jgi:Proteasome assembly chaperone 4
MRRRGASPLQASEKVRRHPLKERERETETCSIRGEHLTHRVTTGAPVMGQVLVSMPRTHYKGAFGTGSKEPSCSQIIGSASSDDQMLASQMASRLTARSGKAVFVSCQLSSSADNYSGGGSWTEGMDSDVISHRAAALAEKKVWNILQEHNQK